jgi:hypothetical protein
MAWFSATNDEQIPARSSVVFVGIVPVLNPSSFESAGYRRLLPFDKWLALVVVSNWWNHGRIVSQPRVVAEGLVAARQGRGASLEIVFLRYALKK